MTTTPNAKPGYLTAAQIAAGAAITCEHGQSLGRNVAIDVFDAMSAAGTGAALATESAASAIRGLLLELTTFDAKLVDGGYLAQRATAILALPQEGGAA